MIAAIAWTSILSDAEFAALLGDPRIIAALIFVTVAAVVLAIGSMIVVGLSGPSGQIIALIIGTAVCTALSTSGALITDFKIGYWIGSTPKNQEVWKFAGVVLAALVVAVVIPVMSKAYDFSNQEVLPAP